MFKHAPLILAALALTALAEPFCSCPTSYPDSLDAGSFIISFGQNVGTASVDACIAACNAVDECNYTAYTEGESTCWLAHINFKRDGSTQSIYWTRTLNRGTCASYNIDATIPAAVCEDYDNVPKDQPTRRARRRQLEHERKRFAAYAAGVY